MKCPHCKIPMIVLELQQVEVDYCPACSGIWLDAGELELLVGDPQFRDRLLDLLKVVVDSKEKKIRCPICHKRMDKVDAGRLEPVIIDKCKRGHGIWFDRDELLQTISQGPLEKDSPVQALLKEMFHYKLK
jgi:Zn-finger nucleic acid-binding protein